jgi:protein SCO1/2
MNIEQRLKKTITLQNDYSTMFRNKTYIGISFIILIFGIYAVPKIINRIENGTIVKGDRLDKVDPNKTKEGKLVKIGPAPQFELVNQDNATITNASYKGKVFVLEFFFTTCPSICPKMNKSMIEIQNKYFGNPNFGIVSITIDPLKDTPEQLKSHAKILGVKSKDWNFLTGDKTAIMDLANKGFNLYAGQNEKVSGGFEHSGLFALIDKNGDIRCRKDPYGNPILYYDSLDKEGVKAIQQDITLLLQE